MLEDYLGKDHKLFVDNWYPSQLYFIFYLKTTETYVVGGGNRKGMPKFPYGKMKKDDVYRPIICWRDGSLPNGREGR